MYVTQTSFLGKTGPLDPSRVINLDPPVGERNYPNRWTEDKNLRTLHNRVNSMSLMQGRGLGGRSRVKQSSLMNTGNETLNQLNVSNQKYLAILYEYIQQEHVWKLLKWLNTISEEHKKGLRVIKTIIDVKGAKRFKMGGTGSVTGVSTKSALQSAVDVDQLDLDGAREFFRKQQTRTSYGMQYGELQKTTGEHSVLKGKKFCDHEYAKFVQRLPLQYVDKWLSINKNVESADEFLKRLFNTTRELYTVIRNQAPTVSTKSDIFKGEQSRERVPRFDKMILNATEIPRASSTNDQKLNMERRIVDDNLSKMILRQKDMKRMFPHEYRADDFKQKFLRGQPYNITSYIELKQPKKTSYQETMAGIQAKDKAQIVDHEHNSCGIGGVIPDPMTMTKNSNRILQFRDDLRVSEKKEFYYTGDADTFARGSAYF